MIKNIFLYLIFFLFFSVTYAQTFNLVDNKGIIRKIEDSKWSNTGSAIYNKNTGSVVINSNGGVPAVNNNAALQFTATDKGILIPRVTLTSLSSTSPFVSLGVQDEGILIFNTATVADVIPGFYYWDKTVWKAVNSGIAENVTGIVAGANGGTGVDNTGMTITLGGNLTTTGAFTTNFTATGNTALTLPTTGTVATLTDIATANNTNANLTGPITSVGNATSVAAQTGTGSTFAMNTTPTFVTNITTPSIIGGTGTAQSLVYKTTTGVGATGADHIFQVGNNGGTEAMRIANNGNVGIGTDTPASKFELSGVAGNNPNLFVTGYGINGSFLGRHAAGSPSAPTAIAANANMSVFGARGYGTTGFSSSSKVSIVMRSSENWTDSAQGTNMGFLTTAIGGTASSEKLTILDNGNVGIGTTTPSATLDVKGTFQLSGATSGGVKFAVPAAAGAATYTWPTTTPVTTGVLQSNNAGDLSWVPAATGNALTSDPLSQFAATTSAQLAGVLSDETGTGSAVFGTSPTLVTPNLGTPSTLVGTNITGIAAGLTAGAATIVTNIVAGDKGGTGVNNSGKTITLGGNLTTTGAFTTNLTTTANTALTLPTTGTVATLTDIATANNTNANLTGMVTSVGNATTVVTNANLTGDVTSVGNATTVSKINGTTMSALSTGILKNTTSTGVPSIAVAGTDYALPNANTTGTASNVTSIVAGVNGGTGVNNSGKTITLGGNLTTTGAFTTNLTTTGNTALTLPTTGTVATLTDIATANNTNANLTGPITSVGNATSVAAQTGTGTTFAMNTSPTFVTNITTPSIIGGSGTAQSLVYKTTTGVGATGADHIFQVGNNGATEAMRIANNGNVGIGTTTTPVTLLEVNGIASSKFNFVGPYTSALTLGSVSNQGLQVSGNGGVARINIVRSDATTNPSAMFFAKSRGTLGSASGAVQPGDGLAQFRFFGDDGASSGTTFNIEAARIDASVDGAVSTNIVPGRLTFSTTPLSGGGVLERMRIDSKGNVGIGNDNPTGVLHLKAGTAAVNTAPIKLTSGTLLTAPEAGAVEFDGTNLYYTNSTPTRQTLATTADITANINLTGPITSVGNATSVAAQTGTGSTFAMNTTPTFVTNITTPSIIGGTGAASSLTYRTSSSSGATTGSHIFQVGTGGTTEAMRIESNGNVGIGTASLAQVNLRVGKNIEGNTASFGVRHDGIVQSGVTGSAYYFSSNAATQASSFTLPDLRHFNAAQGMFGAGSTVANQYGFVADPSMATGTNVFGFYGGIAANTNRWNLFMAGNASNYLAGNLGIGIVAPLYLLDIYGLNAKLRVRDSGQANGLELSQNSSDGGNNIFAVNNNYLAIGTNNTERMRIGSNGNVGIGTTTPSATLDVKGTFQLSGATSGGVKFAVPAAAGAAIYTWPTTTPVTSGVLQSDNAGVLSWAAAATGNALTTNPLSQFAPTTSAQLAGVLSDETGTGLSVFGTAPTFVTNITTPSIIGGSGTAQSLVYKTTTGVGATGADHIFQVGTNGATEAMRITNNGSLGIGTTIVDGFNGKVNLGGSGTPASGTMEGFSNTQVIPATATARFDSFISVPSTVASSFTLGNLVGFRAQQGGIGLGSAVTNQFGFFSDASLTGAANDFGFYGNIPAAAGQYNFYAAGTANNYFAGKLGLGATTNIPTALLHLSAGTAAVNTAPIKLTSGTLLTAPEAGAVEFDGTKLYYTNSTPTRQTLVTTADITANINLTGPITSVGNATSVASQTGAGSTFAMNTSPTFVTNITTPFIIGGIGTTQSLAYRTTTGAGATGADHIFQVGTNGATEAMRILNNGNVGIGNPIPSVPLDVTGAAEITVSSGAAVPLTVTNAGTGNSFVVEDSANPDSTPFVIDNAGNATIGNSLITRQSTVASFGASSSPATMFGTQPVLGVHTTGADGLALYRGGTDANGSSLIFQKTRGAATTTNAIVNSGDAIGSLRWSGADGTNYREAALISASVDGTPGTNDMPGRLVFSTTADGASTPTERMRIGSNGNVGIGTASPLFNLHISGSSALANGVGVRLFNSNASNVNNWWLSTGGNTIESSAFSIGDNSAYKMTFLSSGNIGIGKTDPNATLDVKGTFQLSGATSGGVKFAVPDVAGAATYTWPTTTPVTTGVLQSNNAGNLTWVPAATGNALTSNPLSQFAATTSAQLAGVLSDETGTGSAVFGTSPTLVTPNLGTPSTLVGTNITGTAAGLTAGAATNITGTGIVAGANGGTGVNNGTKTITLGGNLATTGAFPTSLAVTAATSLTLPTTGTLATLAGTETLSNKTLTAAGSITGASGTSTIANFSTVVNSVGVTNYSLVQLDNGKVLNFTSNAAITVTVPAGLSPGFNCLIVQYGSGVITFAASGTTVVNKNSFTKTNGQYAIVTIVSPVSNVFITSGNMN